MFESSSEWSSIEEGLTAAINDPSILLDKFSISEEKCNNLAKGINEGTASVVSDGSFKRETAIGPAGTSAVILSPNDNSNKNECATGANWITGTREEQSAYRSELGGIIAGLTIIDAIIRYKNIPSGSVTIALDNDSAIDESNSDHPISINNKSFDYIQVIKTWINELPIKVNFRNVSGHQLKHRDISDLDWWERMNEEMDNEAKSFLRICTQQYSPRSHTSPILFKEKWSISTDDIKITHPERRNLYIRIYGRQTLDYWNTKDSTPTDPNRIDWESSRQAMRKETKRKRRIDVKLLCEQCGLNKVL